MRAARLLGWLWKVALPLLAVAIILSTFFWLSQSGVVAIEQVVVEGNQIVSTEEIIEKTGPLLRGESLLQLSFEDAARAAESLTYVQSVEFSRDFPHTVHLRIYEHRPFVYLKDADGKIFLSSDEGKVLEEVEKRNSSDLPLLITAEPCDAEPGREIDCADAMNGIDFLTRVPVDFNEKIVEVKVDGGEISFKTGSGATVRFGDLSDDALKFEVARQLIVRTVQAGRLVSIDVSVPERPVTR